MGELWTAIGALSGVGALVATVASWWTQHRRTLTADREATARDAEAAQGRAALVIASALWTSSTTIDVQITNGGAAAITDLELVDVRRRPASPDDGWRLDPAFGSNAHTACLLQPRESLSVKVQLLDGSGEPLSQIADVGLVFRFLDADGQWWRREMGKPPQRDDVQPVA